MCMGHDMARIYAKGQGSKKFGQTEYMLAIFELLAIINLNPLTQKMFD